MNKLHSSGNRARAAIAASALAAALLAGCGGGGSPAAPVDDKKVPASALVSAKAYTEFVGSLPVSNTGEGLSLEGVVAPKSEVAEPLGLT